MLKKLSKDVAVYGIGDLSLRLLGFFVFPIYAHVFSVAEFGVLALITTTTGIIALVASPGLTMALTRYYWDPEVPHGMRPMAVTTGLVTLLLWSTTVVALAIAALFPAGDVIAARYGATWSMVLLGLLAIVPEQTLAYCVNVLRLKSLPWKFTFVSFLKNILGIAVGLVLVLKFHEGLLGLFVGAVAGALLGVPIAVFLIRQELVLTFHLPTARRFVSFGYPFIFAGLAYWIYGSADRWMLATLSTTTELGLYAIAYKFAGIVLFVNGAFGQAWSPFALKLRSDDAGYRVSYARLLSIWFFFLAMCGSAIILFGNEALRLLTPKEYWTAAPVLAPLVMGVVLSGTTQITAIGISLENRTRLFATAAWTTALVNILLNFVLIPRWGALGAGIATFLSYALLTCLYLFWSQRLHPIPLEKSKLAYSITLVVGATAAGIWPLSGEAWSVSGIIAKFAVLALVAAGGVLFGIVDLAAVKDFGRWKRAES